MKGFSLILFLAFGLLLTVIVSNINTLAGIVVGFVIGWKFGGMLWN